MKETFYFTHDYNARQDSKIKNLLRKHGIIAYGIYWAIIEDLYQNANALPTDYECIAFDLRTSDEMVKSIINDFDLFVIKDGLFGSLSVQRRIDERDAKSKKARDSAFARWNKDANALPPQSDSNAIKEKKEKEKKEKEIKEKLFDEFWELYQKKVGKPNAIKEWNKLTLDEMEKVIEVCPKYITYHQDPKFRKDPERFLKYKCWNDEIIIKPIQYQVPQSNQMRSLDHLAHGN